jgi:hypothetical protein
LPRATRGTLVLAVAPMVVVGTVDAVPGLGVEGAF